MLDLDAQVQPAPHVLERPLGEQPPVASPHGIGLGGLVEEAVDAERPVGAAVLPAGLQAHEELLGARDDPFGVHARDGPVDLQEAHADVEAQRPVGGEGHQSGVAPEGTLTLVEQHDVLLEVPADEQQGWFGQGGRITEHEGLFDAECPVGESPGHTVPVERERLGVGVGEHPHEGEHRVPLGDLHVRQSLEPGGVLGEDAGAFGEILPVPAVDVDGVGPPSPDGCLHDTAGGFDVGAVAVGVAGEGEREAGDAVGDRRAVAEGLEVDRGTHRSSSNRGPFARETHGMRQSPASFSAAPRYRSRCSMSPLTTGSRHSPHTP